MLPLTRSHKVKVSNRLAVFAALLLLVTALSGVGGSHPVTGQPQSLASAAEMSGEAPARFQVTGTSSAKKNKGFKMSLFLFRNK